MQITEADRERIRRRYPRRRMSPPLLIALGLVITALVGYVIWVGIHRASPPVTGRVDSFTVLSETQTAARLTIDRPDPGIQARCLVVVQATTFDRVGEKWVDVPPGTKQLTIVDVQVATFKRGTAVTIERCSQIR